MGSLYANDNMGTYDDNLPAPPSRSPSNPGEMPSTTSAENGEGTISKMNGKLRIIFSVMVVIVFIATWAIIGVQFHWISRLNSQNIELNNAAMKKIRTTEDNLVDMIKKRKCFMNLRPNMEGAVFSSSGASDLQSEAMFAELEGRPTSASTGSWCGRAGHGDWIEITFEAPRLVAGIVTQGSPSSDHWTPSFSLSCLSEQGSYEEYTENGKTKIFVGNSNRSSKVFNIFSETLSCRSVRITPTLSHGKYCLRIDLLHAGCYAPASHKFVVTSRGADDGWYCNITVNGIQTASQERGFCAVGFDPHTLNILQQGTFDTYEDLDGQSARMSSFMGRLPAHSIVAIAVQDTALQIDSTVPSNILSHTIRLGAVGVSCDLTHLAYRDSFSFIGQVSRRPEWISCQHVRRHKGYAVVHATIYTSRRFIVH